MGFDLGKPLFPKKQQFFLSSCVFVDLGIEDLKIPFNEKFPKLQGNFSSSWKLTYRLDLKVSNPKIKGA